MSETTRCCVLGAAAMLLLSLPARAGIEDMDFDGDRRADLVVYHAAKGDWYIRNSASQTLRLQNWGWNQAQPVPGDYDGDGRADPCVYDARAGDWYILRSRDGGTSIFRGWGGTEYDPVVADFDGDGRNDLALYHPVSGNWLFARSSDGRRVTWQWGNPQAEPVPGDYDGDGLTDAAVYQRATGAWSIRLSRTGEGVFVNWGWSDAEPVPADYDGDGRTDIAVYHPAAGDWYIRRSRDGQLTLFKSGWYNVQPVPADLDGDGTADPMIYFAQQGNWIANVKGRGELRNWGWSAAESAYSSYRVDDDGAHYGVSFGHDYDDDTFERDGQYPRTGTHAGGGAGTSPVNFAKVQWLHTDVSSWAQTATLRVKVKSSTITLDYDKANVWPGKSINGGVSANANPWIFVPKADGSSWYGATWEWMKVGQTTKSRSSVAGDHIKQGPLNDFTPVAGQWYGFMVSGLARDRNRTVLERSNVVMVQWPADGKESPWFE